MLAPALAAMAATLLCMGASAADTPRAIRTAAAPIAADPLERYRSQLIGEIGQTLEYARRMRECAAARDVEGAQHAWMAARIGWERSEVFINGFVSDVDEEIDAWPNALAGFHAIEARLFGAHTADVTAAADQLIYRLIDLQIKVREIPLNPQGLLNGAARLAYEVGESKADGGESRYSGTSLDDMRNNMAGLQGVYDMIFSPPLRNSDPALARSTEQTMQQLADLLSVRDVKILEPAKVRAASEALIVELQAAAPKIGLVRPTLEDITQ